MQEFAPIDFEEYKNKIYNAIDLFCESNGYKDLTEVSPTVFMAVCMFVGDQVFNTANYKHFQRVKSSKSVINIDDIELLEQLTDLFIFICLSASKEINIYNYCSFFRISSSTVNSWNNGIDYIVVNDNSIDSNIYYNNNLGLNDGNSFRVISKQEISVRKYKLYKKLIESDEMSLQSMLQNGKNPVGTLAILNRRFSWNDTGGQMIGVSRRATLESLPSLEVPQLPEVPLANNPQK